jgi:catechol 2,3-dioxygenase-like lactoylglutathione lyase family enzyme
VPKTGLKVTDLAFIRLGSPDLNRSEEFLTDFGLIKAARTENALYMRATDPTHHVHITEKGPARFIGLAYYVDSEEDLAHATKLPGASAVEELNEPGGGRRVRLTEPNGYQIELVHGLESVKEIKVSRQPYNTGAEPLNRRGTLFRLPKGPTPVKRIAHGVLGTPRMAETIQWFRDNLGFICSDDVFVGHPDNIIASFNRVDRGDEYVDHHAFACVNVGDGVGLHHVSFEVPDLDAVLADHYYLKSKGYEHRWGVGRHTLGSQVYDYWLDPWGRLHEHWADSDRLNASSGSFKWLPEEGLASQWGEATPDSIMTASP